jgi:hypothetical protein
MSRQTDPVIEHQRRLSRERHVRKQVERVDRRKILGCWMAFSSDAFQAMNDMDRIDKELGAKTFIPIVLIMLCATMAHGQAILVLSDTNQLKLLPSHIKVEWRTNLYQAQTDTFVITNWTPIGPPVDLVTNGLVMRRRQFEAGALLTNVSHRITYEGVERVWVVYQATGPVLATRHYDFDPPLPTSPVLAVPNRIQR